MQILKVIRDTDFGPEIPEAEEYLERTAARAIVFDSENKIALLNVTKLFYHKLPGGGVEEGEDLQEALKREAREEIGCEIENIRELGVIEEFRNEKSLHQYSHCYIATVHGEKGQNHLEPDEIDDGFEVEWVSLEDAIKIFESEIGVEAYGGKFIRLRDLTFLLEAQKYGK